MGGKCKDPSAGTTLGTTVGSTNTEDDCQQLLDYTQNTETDNHTCDLYNKTNDP